jgi:hypothetical protein
MPRRLTFAETTFFLFKREKGKKKRKRKACPIVPSD